MKPAEASGEPVARTLVEIDTRVRFQPAPRAPDPIAADDSLRCPCGALLARWVAAGLELKCRRCKQTMLIAYPKKAAATRGRPA
jgi:phage FluMu protein Com